MEHPAIDPKRIYRVLVPLSAKGLEDLRQGTVGQGKLAWHDFSGMIFREKEYYLCEPLFDLLSERCNVCIAMGETEILEGEQIDTAIQTLGPLLKDRWGPRHLEDDFAEHLYHLCCLAKESGTMVGFCF